MFRNNPWVGVWALTDYGEVCLNGDMTITADLRFSFHRAARRIFGPVLAACLVAYFAFYAIYGDRGLMSLKRLEADVAAAEAVLEKVREERVHVERRVALLRSESLDPDMLDERARAVLNFTRPDEVIILIPNGAAPNGAAPNGAAMSPEEGKASAR